MSTLEEIIEELFGIKQGATDLTPMDYGECKKAVQTAVHKALEEAAEEIEQKLIALYADLMKNAYNPTYHNYYFKEANQIIRQHFSLLQEEEKEEKELLKEAYVSMRHLPELTNEQEKIYYKIEEYLNKTLV